MFEGLEDLDLPESSHRHAFLLVVHQDTLQRNVSSGLLMDSFMDLTADDETVCPDR